MRSHRMFCDACQVGWVREHGGSVCWSCGTDVDRPQEMRTV